MNFDFSDEQQQFREQVRRLVADTCPPGKAREVIDGRALYSAELWSGLCELGALGIGIPERLGGVGLGVLELCVVAEELGRVVAPTPLIACRALAMEALLRSSAAEAQQTWLPVLASGKSIACYASALTSRGRLSLAGTKLTGTIGPVLAAPIADLAIIGATFDNREALVAISLRNQDVLVDRVDTIDASQPQGDITFTGAECTVLATGDEAARIRTDTERFAALVTAFEQLGGASACLQMARDYALTRYAFGRLIGSYQAIKHKLADVHVKNTLARAHAYFGAWTLETHSSGAPLAVAGARAACSEAFNFAAQENMQTHGGIGFTWEHDCHLYYRRARLLSLWLAPSGYWKELLVRELERPAGA